MNSKKNYWGTLALTLFISILPLIIMITYPVKNAAILLFVIYGLLSLIATANLASYLTICISKKNELGSLGMRVIYLVINSLIILFNIGQVFLIHLMF